MQSNPCRSAMLRTAVPSLSSPAAALARQRQGARAGKLDEIAVARTRDAKVNVTWSRNPFARQRSVDDELNRFLMNDERTPIRRLGLPSAQATIDDDSIDSTCRTDVGIRFAFDRDDARETFGNTNNLLAQAPLATAPTLGRTGVDEFKDGSHNVLGHRMVGGARPSC